MTTTSTRYCGGAFDLNGFIFNDDRPAVTARSTFRHGDRANRATCSSIRSATSSASTASTSTPRRTASASKTGIDLPGETERHAADAGVEETSRQGSSGMPATRSTWRSAKASSKRRRSRCSRVVVGGRERRQAVRAVSRRRSASPQGRVRQSDSSRESQGDVPVSAKRSGRHPRGHARRDRRPLRHRAQRVHTGLSLRRQDRDGRELADHRQSARPQSRVVRLLCAVRQSARSRSSCSWIRAAVSAP